MKTTLRVHTAPATEGVKCNGWMEFPHPVTPFCHTGRFDSVVFTADQELRDAARKHVDAECRCSVGTHGVECELVLTEEALRAALEATE